MTGYQACGQLSGRSTKSQRRDSDRVERNIESIESIINLADCFDQFNRFENSWYWHLHWLSWCIVFLLFSHPWGPTAPKHEKKAKHKANAKPMQSQCKPIQSQVKPTVKSIHTHTPAACVFCGMTSLIYCSR